MSRISYHLIHAGAPRSEECIGGLTRRRETRAAIARQQDGIVQPVLRRRLHQTPLALDGLEAQRFEAVDDAVISPTSTDAIAAVGGIVSGIVRGIISGCRESGCEGGCLDGSLDAHHPLQIPLLNHIACVTAAGGGGSALPWRSFRHKEYLRGVADRRYMLRCQLMRALITNIRSIFKCP